MAHNAGVRIVGAQAVEQGTEGGALRPGTCVGRMAVGGETALVADADAVLVEPLGMSALLMERTAGMDHAVAGDVEMIADVGKAAGQVVAPTIF